MDEQRPELDMEAVEERAAAGLPVGERSEKTTKEVADEEVKLEPQQVDPRMVELRELQRQVEDLKLKIDLKKLEDGRTAKEHWRRHAPETPVEMPFSPDQISCIRAEIVRAWSEIRTSVTKRDDRVRDEKAEALHPSHTAASDSQLVSLAEQIVGCVRELEGRLEPVLLGPRDEPSPPEGSPMVSALGFIRLALDQLIDRINI